MNTIYQRPGAANEKGTGLGSFLCKEFISKHSGKIWAESKVGEGSKFIFTLPVFFDNKSPGDFII
jgi:signal transduction histidine kinase